MTLKDFPLDDYSLWVSEMNDKSVIRDRKEEVEIVYNKEIALPVKRYSVI